MKKAEYYLSLAIEEARRGVEAGDGGPFGAVIVHNGTVIARTHNEVVRRKDPTAHAEILAIRIAAKRLDAFHLRGCHLYCTGEPCPMCFSAIHWAHLERVVYCNTKADAAAIGFDDDAITEIIRGDRPDPIPFIHRPTDACHRLLGLWSQKPDKVLY